MLFEEQFTLVAVVTLKHAPTSIAREEGVVIPGHVPKAFFSEWDRRLRAVTNGSCGAGFTREVWCSRVRLRVRIKAALA